jgi:hypothetical protein
VTPSVTPAPQVKAPVATVKSAPSVAPAPTAVPTPAVVPMAPAPVVRCIQTNQLYVDGRPNNTRCYTVK